MHCREASPLANDLQLHGAAILSMAKANVDIGVLDRNDDRTRTAYKPPRDEIAVCPRVGRMGSIK